MNNETTRNKNQQQQKKLLTKAITLQYFNYITTTTVDNSKNKVDEGNQLKCKETVNQKSVN